MFTNKDSVFVDLESLAIKYFVYDTSWASLQAKNLNAFVRNYI